MTKGRVIFSKSNLKYTKILFTLFFLIFFFVNAFGMEHLFYVLHNKSSSSIQHTLNILSKHTQSIHTLILQAYQIDQHGNVSGYVNPPILKFAKQHAIKQLALVTNASFDDSAVHQFLHHPLAQKKALQTLLELCKKNQYDGIQFDFEMISLQDRNSLTEFYCSAAQLLHAHHLLVSFAIAPQLSPSSPYQKRLYEVWKGAYDLKALSHFADFVSIMAYNQHEHGTVPGPTAGIQWTEAVVNYALHYMPAEKISLGIPTYSSYWYTGTPSGKPHGKIATRLAEITYHEVLGLLKKYHTHLQWNPNDKINYAMYERNWLNEYIFAEDAASFKEKTALAKKYQLKGISVFYLGIEDPNIWRVLQ